ncbi:MAG: glycosyltransferase [Deltaproteobacteria bacterium]|nr:glycosyltransferase [Deltaproteobacteria bacterium]NIS76646.1 glycosyltransferase [Deltaproteobacteria bacterium]
MENTKVTLLMSVYNGERYLREAVESILNQTFEDFLFFIVNDGSTDGTGSILQGYRDRRIRVVENEMNLGLTRSLNRGIEMIRSEYVARMDADDIALPERLEKEVDFLDRHRNIGLVGTYYLRIDEKGNVVDEERPISDTVELREKLLEGNRFAHGSVMFRKECVEKVGYYREAFQASQDYDLWLRIAEYYDMANIPEFLYKWRLNVESISVSGKAIQDEYASMAVELARERRKFGRDRLQIMDECGDGVSLVDVLKNIHCKDRKNSIRGYSYWGDIMLEKENYNIALNLFWRAFIRDPFDRNARQGIWKVSRLSLINVIVTHFPEPIVNMLKMVKRAIFSKGKGRSK